MTEEEEFNKALKAIENYPEWKECYGGFSDKKLAVGLAAGEIAIRLNAEAEALEYRRAAFIKMCYLAGIDVGGQDE